MHHHFYKKIKQHSCFQIVIYEGSCDTEYWSNDAENSASHHRNQIHLKIYFKLIVFQNWLYFDQINASLVTLKAFFKKNWIPIMYTNWSMGFVH